MRLADNTIVRLETGGFPLGMFPSVSYEEAAEELGPGSCLLLYTDGVCDATNHSGEEYGESRLLSLLVANSEADAPTLTAFVRDQVSNHCAGVFSDDVTILTVTLTRNSAAVA